MATNPDVDRVEEPVSPVSEVVVSVEAVAPDSGADRAGPAEEAPLEGYMCFCRTETFGAAMADYLAEVEVPPQWNAWQRVAYAIAPYYEEQHGGMQRRPEAGAIMSALYQETMEARYGPEWRAKRPMPEGAARFVNPPDTQPRL